MSSSKRGRVSLVVVVGAAALGLSSCTGTSSPPSDAPTQAASPSTSGQSSAVPPLPVASVFGPAAWGIQLPGTSRQKRPIVTAQRVAYLDGESVRAVDSMGQAAWTAQFPAFTSDARIKDDQGYPFLRLAGPNTVAVVDAGKASGSGLAQDGYETRVTLLDLGTGTVIKAVTVPGSATSAPKPGTVGLALSLPDGKGVTAILPNGTTKPLPASTSVREQSMTNDGGATVGSSSISAWGSNTDAGANTSSSSGFAGLGWTSVSEAPSTGFMSASIVAGDADRLLVGRWVAPGKTAMDAPTIKVQVLDASTGKVVARPSCEPIGQSVFSASPDGKHLVLGPIRMDGSGANATCIGGGTNQKTVILTAITDEAVAFGTAGAGGSSTSFVTVAPDGKVTTEPLAAGEAAPIGIMDGAVAVFWDPAKAVLTGNPIK